MPTNIDDEDLQHVRNAHDELEQVDEQRRYPERLDHAVASAKGRLRSALEDAREERQLQADGDEADDETTDRRGQN